MIAGGMILTAATLTGRLRARRTVHADVCPTRSERVPPPFAELSPSWARIRSIALQSLFHDRSKLLAAIAGVSFAALLVYVQFGLYEGFLWTSSATIAEMGGDLWVSSPNTTARG